MTAQPRGEAGRRRKRADERLTRKLQRLDYLGYECCDAEGLQTQLRHWFGEKPIPFVTTQEQTRD